MSTGFPTLAASGRNARSAAAVLGEKAGSSSPLRLARVGRQDPRSSRVRQDADAAPCGQRLVRKQHRDVEELLERSRPDDAGLPEQRVDDPVRLRQGAGVRRRGPRAGLRAAGLDGDDRLAARDAARDPREPDGIPEALEVEEDHLGPRVFRPVLDEIVSGDVRLVADRDERRDAEIELRGVVEKGEAQGAALRGERHLPLRGIDRAEGGVQPEARIRVDEAHAVGPDHPHARRRAPFPGARPRAGAPPRRFRRIPR